MVRGDAAGDGHAVMAAVEAIYDAAPDPHRWPQALQAIADVFEDVGTVLLWGRDDSSIGSLTSPALASAQKDYVEQGWNTRDSRSKLAIERGIWTQREIVTDHHIMTPEEMAAEPFYTDFLAKHGLRYCLAAGISPDPHLVVGLSVQRAIGRPKYTQHDIDTMTVLARHAEKSLRLSIRLLDAELAKVGLGEALSRLDIGVFALDSLGRVVFTNPAGERLLGDGLVISNRLLLANESTERTALNRLIGQMLHTEPSSLTHNPTPLLIRRRKSERPLAVYVLPVTSRMSLAAQFLTHTRAIVLVIDADDNAPADPAIVRDVLGLTLGEARVASLVGSSLPPRETAQRLGLTEETVRTTLKRVFSKTGVSTQSELVALLSRMVLR